MAKEKLSQDELDAMSNIDGIEVMTEMLKNKGLAAFPDTRMVPLSSLMETALIIKGWTFTETNKKYASYFLFRFFRRNGYDTAGTVGRELVKIPISVFTEIQNYETDWRKRQGR